MFNKLFKKNEKENFKNFTSGEIIHLKDVNDKVFSSGMLGEGYAIIPDDGKIYAPLSGKVESLFPTGHALGLKSDLGYEILIHLGIDTVELNGEGFFIKTSEGKKVKQGDILIEMDLDKIKNSGKDPVCILVFTKEEKIKILKEGKAKALEENIIEIN